MSVFIVSLLVALISTVFSARIARKVTNLLAPAPTTATTLERSPEIVRQTVVHALDVSSAFPASILTIIAYAAYFPRNELSTALIVVAAVVSTIFFFWFSDSRHAPGYQRLNVRRAGRYSPRRLGVLNIVIVIANVVGVILAACVSPPTSG